MSIEQPGVSASFLVLLLLFPSDDGVVMLPSLSP